LWKYLPSSLPFFTGFYTKLGALVVITISTWVLCGVAVVFGVRELKGTIDVLTIGVSFFILVVIMAILATCYDHKTSPPAKRKVHICHHIQTPH